MSLKFVFICLVKYFNTNKLTPINSMNCLFGNLMMLTTNLLYLDRLIYSN